MPTNDLYMELARQQFARLKRAIAVNEDDISVLEKKTEKSGETDGFQIVEFADLLFAPDVTQTRFVYVSDGRDVGEGAGNGTGCLAVYKPSLDNWYRVADNSIVVV